jgi:hypothetical protein
LLGWRDYGGQECGYDDSGLGHSFFITGLLRS